MTGIPAASNRGHTACPFTTDMPTTAATAPIHHTRRTRFGGGHVEFRVAHEHVDLVPGTGRMPDRSSAR